jgi:hypothetical protein
MKRHGLGIGNNKFHLFKQKSSSSGIPVFLLESFFS